MPQKNSQTIVDSGNNCQSVVEPALLDIYLCDHCEAELYTLEVYRVSESINFCKSCILLILVVCLNQEHERNCKFDDDVIFCGIDDSAYLPNEEPEEVPDTLLKQSLFLQMFNLKNDSVPLPALTPLNKTPTKRTPEKLKRWPKRGRQVMLIAKCPTIPISSPAGQRLISLSKITLSSDYLRERLDRTERFCLAPCLGRMSAHSRIKFMDRKPQGNTIISSSFRRPPDYSYHQYTFPRRQFSKRRRHEAFLHLNWGELRQCQPVSINIKKISLTNLRSRDNQRFFVSNEVYKQSTPQTSSKETDPRRQSKSNVKRKQSNKFKCEKDYSTVAPEAHTDFVIDLCSSDEEHADANQPKAKRRNTPANTIESPVAQVSIHPIHPSATHTDPGSSTSLISSQPGSLSSSHQHSVQLISHLTQTAMTLDNHQKTYRFQNQENNFQHFVNRTSAPSSVDSACGPLEIASLPNSITLTTANHRHTINNKLLPDVVLERITNGVIHSAPNQQLCIDLT